jgi:hypothetical protein
MTMKDLKQDVDLTFKVPLEWEFPLSFSNVMTHLLVHLMKKLQLCNPMHTWWMCHIECYFRNLKGFVRNKARVEGNIIEGYAL